MNTSLLELEAVLFDLDGVLTSTATLHAAAWKETFDEVMSELGDPQASQTTSAAARSVDRRCAANCGRTATVVSVHVRGYVVPVERHGRVLALSVEGRKEDPEPHSGWLVHHRNHSCSLASRE